MSTKKIGRAFAVVRRQAGRAASLLPGRRRTPRPRGNPLRALLSFLETASQLPSADALTGEALATIAPQYHYELGGIHLLDETGQLLLMRAHYGSPPELVTRTRQLRLGDGIAGRVARDGIARLARIPGSGMLPAATEAALAASGIRHQYTVPLQAHGRMLGTLSLSARRRDPPKAAERGEIQAFAQALALALELRRRVDLTESAAAQAETVIVHSGDMIGALSPEGLILEMNPAGRALLGAAQEGQALTDFVDRRDRESLRAALTTGRAQTLQIRRPAAVERDAVWLEISLTPPAPWRNRAGAASKAVVATGRDISERKRVELELARRNQELFALNKVSALAATQTTLKARLPELLDRCLKLAGCDSGGLYRLSTRTGELIGLVNQGYGKGFLAGRHFHRISPGEGTLGELALAGEVVVVDDPGKFLPAAAAAALQKEGVKCGIAIALRSGERTHGLLTLTHHRTRTFDTYELSLIATLAHQLGAAFETQSLLTETGNRLHELQLLYALGRTLAQTLELDGLLKATVAHLRQLMLMDGSFIWLREGTDQLRIAAASEGHEPLVGFSARLTDRGVAAEAVRRGEPVTSASPRERRKIQRSLLEKSGMEAVLAVPLIVRGEAIGALVFGRRNAAVSFTTDEQRRAMTISQPVAIALDNARLFDATQRQQAALKALSTEVLRAQEEERRRLSRELHDGVAQSASALRLSLTALRAKLAKIAPPSVLRECDELILIAGDSATEVRRLSADLRPPILDELGLLPTLRAHVETMQRRSRLRIEFTAGELPKLPAGYDINLYRIAQEALTNVIKHAKARHARVKLAADHGKVRLEITDDGAGFDPATVHPSDQGGLGLLGMRERAALFGGTLEIHSEPGAGCRLVITVPLPDAPSPRR